MPLTNFPQGLSSFGIPMTGPWGNIPIAQPYQNAEVFFVDAEDGDNGNLGDSPTSAVATITRALALATSGVGAMIFVAPGSYVENVVVTKDYICLIGMFSGGYARPDVVPSSGVALTVSTAQGFVCSHMRFAAPAADTDLVLQQGNGYLYDDCVFDGDSTQGNAKALVRLKGYATDDSYTASEGIIRNCLFRGSGGDGLIFDDGDAPGNGVGVTDCVIGPGNRFYSIDQIAIATADTGAGIYSVQNTLIVGNHFMDKGKATYVDFTTSNGGAASDQTGAFNENVIASDTMTTTKIKAVGTGFTFAGNIDTVGIFDGSGLD